MSMNVNTTGTVYGSYQNTYKAGTVDKKKETAKTTEKCFKLTHDEYESGNIDRVVKYIEEN